MDDEYEYFKLSYTIHKYSSYSGNYKPENILVKKPTDQLSRWFTDSTTPSQFIMLKLQTTSIVQIIRFGKYMKSHVSDLKKFQVYGGLEEDNLSLLLTAGLKKDNLTETFSLRCQTSEGLTMPVNFIKIVPLQSWGPAYNYTIWYVELQGKNQEDIINSAIDIINLRKEEEAVRILLKHLRRRRYKDAFEALSRESGVQLEGPVQSRLWDALVEMGDFKMTEKIFEEAANEGELDWYMSWQPYTPSWRALCPCSDAVEERLARPPSPQPLPAACADRDTDEPVLNGGESRLVAGAEDDWADSGARPPPRGGHQLVVDPKTGTLYLFGGWNGMRDLDDLWSFDTETERWTLLCRNSRLEGGPQPRSCHKMVFDPVHGKLYILGRYLDSDQRTPENMMSDLYSYDVGARRWRLECADTAAAGGPPLVFDHQMCIDADAQVIYVFGGRVLPKSSEDPHRLQYSGLYAYHIGAGTWRLLLPDNHEQHAPQPRVSHSMLFHPTERRLYVFAGQRNREQLVDMWWWEPGGAARALCRARTRAPPPPSFTQRATIDPDAGEIYVLSGMSASHDKGGSGVQNSLWVYSLRRRAWACAYANDSVSAAHPRPRFAHQLVLDPVRKVHYLFGGNPGRCTGSKVRLDDLWALRLSRPVASEVVAVACRAIREAALREMAADPSRAPAALHYLRNDVREVTDINDPEQRASFQSLATLVVCGARGGAAARALCPRRARALHRARHAAAPAPHLARHLAQVLGAEDSFLEPTQPYEEAPPSPSPPPEEESDDDDGEWAARAARVRLYERLCRYFRPSRVPPRADVMDMVTLLSLQFASAVTAEMQKMDKPPSVGSNIGP